ncbi:hypothetical protein, partial [Xylanibacter caecicola]|uniref:hypothetical protein n=1 Tax=Xylanibacter caecicola TaxID=2736294 RepID=UPI002583B2FA
STFGASGREDGASIGNFGSIRKKFWNVPKIFLDRFRKNFGSIQNFLSNVQFFSVERSKITDRRSMGKKRPSRDKGGMTVVINGDGRKRRKEHRGDKEIIIL